MILSSEIMKIIDSVYILKTINWQEFSRNGKFIQAIETQNPEEGEALEISQISTRTYYKMNVEKKCKAIISLHQDDEKELGIKESRPNIDLGFFLLKQSEKLLKMFCFVESRVQREVYLETELDEGTYFLVPKTAGRNFIFKEEYGKERYQTCENNIFHSKINDNNFIVEENKTSNNDQIIWESLIEDTFRKYNNNSEFLIEKDLIKIEKKIKHTLILKSFQETLNIFEPKNINSNQTEKTGLSMRGFKKLFNHMLESNIGKKHEILNHLGYDEDFFSNKSRVFTFGLRSTETIKIETKDALKGNKKINSILLIIDR